MLKIKADMIKRLASIVLLFAPLLCLSQETYTLSQCIEIAQKNNIAAQQAALSQTQNETNLKSAEYARLPNLNLGAGNNYSFGRTIDPFSNTFINQNVNSVSLNLSSSTVLYNGLRIRNNIQSAQSSLEAGEKNLEAIENNVSLDVAALYLGAVLAKEQIRLFQNNIKQTAEQLDRINVLLEAGAATIDRKLELEAQLSTDELNLVNAQNSAQIGLLNLRNYLNLPVGQTFDIAEVGALEINSDKTDTLNLEKVIEDNYKALPQVKRDELLLQASEHNLASARSNLYPSLNFSANLNSLYSSQSSNLINPRVETFQIGYVGTDLTPVFSSQQVFDRETPGFTEQINNNFGQTFGFSMSVPIFNRYAVTAGIENAKVNNQRQLLQLQNTKNELQNSIYQAYLNWQAAEKAYEAAAKALTAQQKLLEQTQLRYDAGAANYFDWLTVRNNFTSAEVNVLRAKYDLIFKEKTFGFYLGDEITF